MGCAQSKIEDEESVIRCRDRKQFMRDAVTQRNAFAAAHSAYAVALKNTGAALSDYAQGEVRDPQQIISGVGVVPAPTAAPPVPFETLLPPPPPQFRENPENFPPLQRTVSAPEIKVPKAEVKPVEPMIEEGEEDDDDDDLESEPISSLRQRSSRGRVQQPPPPQKPHSPPRSVHSMERHGAQPQEFYDYFFSPVENVPAPSLSEVVEERKVFSEPRIIQNRMEHTPMAAETVVEFSEPRIIQNRMEHTPMAAETVVQPPMPPSFATVVENGGGRSMKKGKAGTSGSEVKRGSKYVNLAQIFVELDDHFLKASESAYEVSKMLEATRLHYHSNFADNRGHIDHSARVMQVITWNRSFRGLQNDVPKDDFDSEENETHATVLDKLLAWEKKLYDEVKAGEILKYDYQRKVAALNKQKKRNPNSESLEKIKAAVSHLHTRYIVDMQSMDSTVLEINRLRDEQLYPKLVQLVDGMARMWEVMQSHHEAQYNAALDLRYIDISQSPKETTDHHHDRTIQLLNVVQDWHVQFCRLVDYQKDYIKALNSWLKLNLIPIESSLKERVSSPARPQTPPIETLIRSWQQSLDSLPDELGRTAIFNFRAVIETIVHHQEDEIKLRHRCEQTKNELIRKTRSFEDWHRKYMEKRTPPDEMDPDRAELERHHHGALAERELAVELVRKRLEEEEDAYRRQCSQVREKTLASFKNRMPELFKAMLDFSGYCTEMYEGMRSVSRH